MTEHLYYHDSFLYDFEANVTDVIAGDRTAVVLDRTAFYPTSGGQVFDTGWISTENQDSRARVTEVAEREDGSILHYIEDRAPDKGTRVRGIIDQERRRDHMQQHSGQHVLSAAFVRLLNIPTVSFHMGADSCSIDLDTENLTAEQVQSAEALANDIVTENRPVDIRFVSQEEAHKLGLRKLPPAERDQLRLIDIRDFDLTACGGTHVRGTGQIGAILLRKAEQVKQGWRIAFVCGRRAVAAARRDYVTLTEAAGLFSAQLGDVPQQIRKTHDELRAARKSREQLLEEVADLNALRLLEETPESNGKKIIARVFEDRDLAFIKLLAQRLTRRGTNVVALLGATQGAPALVFAASSGLPLDMGSLMRESLTTLGGRGGGSKDMAQGGPQNTRMIPQVLNDLSKKLAS